MPNPSWHKDLVGTLSFLSAEMAVSLPKVISLLFRSALLFLFFWFLVDFIYELGSRYWQFAAGVGLAALFVLATLCWNLFNSWSDFDLKKLEHDKGKLPAGSPVAFVALNLFPIAAVALATWGPTQYKFNLGLLQYTQGALERIASLI